MGSPNRHVSSKMNIGQSPPLFPVCHCFSPHAGERGRPPTGCSEFAAHLSFLVDLVNNLVYYVGGGVQ